MRLYRRYRRYRRLFKPKEKIKWKRRLKEGEVFCSQCLQTLSEPLEVRDIEGKLVKLFCPVCYAEFSPKGWVSYSPIRELFMCAVEQKFVELWKIGKGRSISLEDYNQLINLNLANQLERYKEIDYPKVYKG